MNFVSTNQNISSNLESEMHLGQRMDLASLTLIGMRQGGFKYLPYNLGLDFVSWIFIKNFQTFLEVKNLHLSGILLTLIAHAN